MRIQTALTQVEKFKSFVYGAARREEHEDRPVQVVQMEPRKNSRGFCSGCGPPGRVYDRLEPRRLEFVPVWGSWSSLPTGCGGSIVSGVG
jgi:hypothetical protein